MSLLGAADSIRSSHLPLREVVATQIRRLILEGTLQPGERLIEDRLAEKLGVSRNPVREAIRILEAEGFLDVAARRGSSVATLSAKQAANLFDVRLALEPLGARLAARSPSRAGIDRMKQILTQVQSQPTEFGPDVLSNLHTELHSIIFEMTDNDYLMAIALPMVKRGQWLLRQNASLEDPSAWAEHHGLISAIEDGDEDLAEAQARHHVLSVRHEMTRRLAEGRW